MGLTLISTPIAETGEITAGVKDLLLKSFERGDTILIEDEKPARKRWRAWGLPREAIESFTPYNEHTRDEWDDQLIKRMKQGEKMLLMSDGGTPGFCDPGRSLIEKCHRHKIKVSITESCNSLIPAVSLSGFTEGAFEFLGFTPRDKEERQIFFESLFKKSHVQVFMDTPYRLERVAQEVKQACPKAQQGRLHCIVSDINRESEEIHWGEFSSLPKKLGKKEFLWILGPLIK